MIPLNPLSQDQKTVSERKWRDGLKPHKDQLPCDLGLFSDDHILNCDHDQETEQEPQEHR